jgi:hypothetical protein
MSGASAGTPCFHSLVSGRQNVNGLAKLWGLRAHSSRGDFQFYIESQATDLLHLASTLVLDLGLHNAPNPYGAGRQSFLPDAIRRVKGAANYAHTLDDMRAMLGFFYLNSVYVSFSVPIPRVRDIR